MKFFIAIFIAFCLPLFATIVDDIENMMKKTNLIEKVSYQKLFHFENKKDKVLIDNILNKLNFLQVRDIVIIYDDFTDVTHGKDMLKVIDDGTNKNILLFDYKTNNLMNKYQNKLSTKKVNFELFFTLLAKKYRKHRVILSKSNVATSLESQSHASIIAEYNLCNVKLIYDNENVFMNRAFGNLRSEEVSKYLALLLKNRIEQRKFISKIEYFVDNSLWNLDKKNLSVEDKLKIKQELMKFKNYNLVYFDDFVREYFKYAKMKVSKNADSYFLLASLSYLKHLYPKSDIDERISIVKSITAQRFKENVINAYNNNLKLPKGIMTFAINLHKDLGIEDKDDLKSFKNFQKYSNKYKLQYPYLFQGKYDLNIDPKTVENTSTMFDGIFIGTKKTKYYGTSISSAVQTYLEQYFGEDKVNVKNK